MRLVSTGNDIAVIAVPVTPTAARAAVGGRACVSRGFTLLEMMLVIALAAILATIAIPQFRGAVDRAKVAAAVGDIGRMKLRIDAYRLNNNDVLPPSLGTIGMDTLNDPWGRPYSYLPFAGVKGKGAFRKDKNLVPINSDYDLYSVGADGKSAGPLSAKASQDDVIMANDGAFIGLASDY